MHAIFTVNWWTFATVFAAQVIVFIRWIYRRIRNDEITRIFVQDIATNHLPHIYELLYRLCEQQGITRTQAPVVRWIGPDEPKS